MGTGNYRHADGETVILNLFDDIDIEESPDPQFEADLIREDFRLEFETLIAHTAFELDFERWRGRDALVLAENRLYQIWSHEDSYGHSFITYGLHEDLDPAMEGLARAHLETRAERFFDALQEIYPDVRVATSAWTSGPRLKAADRQAPHLAA
jgi:hypothetical protein